MIEEGYASAGASSRVEVIPPNGYAVAAAGRDGSYRALSPEGLPFRVRAFLNAPEQSLPFWSEALTSHLRKEGYRPAGESRSFQAGNDAGRIFEWVVPYAGKATSI